MRQLVLCLGFSAAVIGGAQVANAADLPMKAPAYVTSVGYNWTGFYIGGHTGYGWATQGSTNTNGNAPFPAGTSHSTDLRGWLGGVQAGYNYQFSSNFLIGIEGDYTWSGLDGTNARASVVPGFTATRFNSEDSKIKWMGTVTGRLGWAMNNWLLYGKGGVAWAHSEANATTVNPALGGLLLTTTSSDDTRVGWTIGAGLEWGFLPNWSAKLEYDYMNFGTSNLAKTTTYFNGATGLNPLRRDVDLHVSVVKVGLNYRFN